MYIYCLHQDYIHNLPESCFPLSVPVAETILYLIKHDVMKILILVLQISHKKENYRQISLMNIDAKILSKMQIESNNTLKESYTMIKWGLSQGCKDFQYTQINRCDTSYKQIERWKPYGNLSR